MLLASSALALLAAPAAAQEAAPPTAPAPDAAPALAQESAAPTATPEIGPVQVDLDTLRRALPPEAVPAEGLMIPATSVRRQLVYQFGSAALEARKLDVFIKQEMQNQIDAGADPTTFGITEEEVAAAVQETIEQVKLQYPTLEPETVLIHNQVDVANLPTLTRQGKLFDMVFLPDDPNEWPPVTTEALKSRLGLEFIEKLQEGYAERKKLEESQTPEERAQTKQNQGMFNMLMRQQVRQALDEAADVQTAGDELPVDVAMRVNGVDIKTDDVFAEIAPRLSAQDIEDAQRWLVKNALVEQALKASGSWLSDEEFAAEWAAHEEENANSLFPLEALARTFKGFPSMESYAQHYRLLESFERHLGELDDAMLQAHMDARANDMLNLATVEAEVILVSAFDFEKNKWIEDGWEKAAQEAVQVVEALADASGENWDELLETHSDFWDPPAPAQPMVQQQPPQRKNKGRLGARNRNDMLRLLGESDYTIYLDGFSVVDEIFFQMEAGEVGGPFLGPHGYYIVRIVRRSPPAGMRGLGDAPFRDMVRQDYVADQLNQFAAKLYDATMS